MIYPPQTSFIPITVAVTRWVEANGFGGNYPYWYLGTTPAKYLMGSVVPSVLVMLHKLLPNFSFFDLSLFFIFVSFFVSAVGWGTLAAKLSKNKSIGYLTGVLSLVLPWHIFYSFAFGEVSSVFTGSLTPWVLIAYAKFKISNSKFKIILPVVAFAFLLLVNTTASIPAVVGLLILGLLKYKKWEEGFKEALLVIFVGWLVTLFWYGPVYYLTIWGAPSFGGRSAAGSLVWVFNLLRGFIPFFLALFVVFWGVKTRSLFAKFALSWFLIFGFLTLVRFVANLAFWLDFSAWVSEVEVGLALLIAGSVSRFLPTAAIRLRVTKDFILLTIFFIYLVGGWVLAFANKSFWMPRKDIDQSVELRIGKELNNMVSKNDVVFLSGTTAFWLNSFYDIRQVRGGRDEISQHPSWRAAEWEVRNGDSGIKAREALRSLGVTFLVVHMGESQEFYHDFANIDKFRTESGFNEIYRDHGDLIYRIAR